MAPRILLALITAAVCFAQAPASPVAGVGNFSHVVADLERSLAFYRDVIGLEVNGAVRPFEANPAIQRLGNTGRSQSRFVTLKAPGADLGVEIIEYKDVDRKAADPGLQDPGAASLSLRVRDIDAIMARVTAAGARVVTKGGATNISGGRRMAYVKDPDGFFVELMQGAPPAQPAAAGASNILGAGFMVAVENTDNSVKFYREAMGAQAQSREFVEPLSLLMDLWGTPGGQYKRTAVTIPGTSVGISLHETSNIRRTPLRTRTQDPGTAILQLRVRDVDAATKAFQAAGAELITAGGEPVSLGNMRLSLLRGPDNLFFELLAAR
jgi:catechol 2,3-dioxygenase-like lactoylglutathione lyase family enzyme